MLVVVPWALVAGLYLGYLAPKDEVASGGPARQASGDVTAQRASGSWGELQITPIVISPPVEFIPLNLGPVPEAAWHFQNSSTESVETFLRSSGVDGADVSQLLATARPSPAVRGIVVKPTPDLLRRLAPDVRGRIYLRLLENSIDEFQVGLYRFYGSSIEAWLGSDIEPATRSLVEPLIFQERGFFFFGDLDLVRSQIGDAVQLQRLLKRLSRQATVLVKLRVDGSSDVAALADYWGRGGRRTDIRPLLESLANAGPTSDHLVDISHLLPTLARERLYRYPQITVADFEKPVLANCLWTALNFFARDPDDRFLDVSIAMKHLKEDYYVIQDGFQLGDVVAFSDGEGNLFHVAVFLADDLVFGKNGSTYLAPWSILPMTRLRGHYIQNADDWHITVHRRKGM